MHIFVFTIDIGKLVIHLDLSVVCVVFRQLSVNLQTRKPSNPDTVVATCCKMRLSNFNGIILFLPLIMELVIHLELSVATL